EMKTILTAVYDALKEKGYNPVNQIVGYLLSEDPTYITTHNNARALIRKLDRDELLHMLIQGYIDS
ncbi:MAG: IreB family regulatory phosphoprotein, partial [Ethanoligenens sp.]